MVFQKAAETHLPVLESKEGISISMDDIDGLHVWSFKYRFVYFLSSYTHAYKPSRLVSM